MTIVTTTPQILDANGMLGFGTVTITPSQAFTYFDGVSTISVTNDSVVIGVTNGQLDSALVLAPTSGATNSPEIYYIVDLLLRGTEKRIRWSLPAPASTTEFNDVAIVPSGTSVNAELQAFLRASNPLPQYLTRTDTVNVKTPTVGASDGRGLVPRTGKTSGYLDKSFYLNVAGPDDSALTSADVPIVDAGGYFTATQVEGALQEAGASLTALSRPPITNYFTSSGTWTATYSGLKAIHVAIQGGGGGGGGAAGAGVSQGNAAGGGGAGGYASGFIDAANLASYGPSPYTVTIGGGGAGGSSGGTNGSAGGNSSISSTTTMAFAPGGYGGTGDNRDSDETTYSQAGGAISPATAHIEADTAAGIQGGAGSRGFIVIHDTVAPSGTIRHLDIGGVGGSSPMGGPGGTAGICLQGSTITSPTDGVCGGGGGGASAPAAKAGGAGGDGYIIITEFY